MCEKPIATKLEDADAMVVEAAEQAGVKFTMGYQHRFGTLWPAVKNLLDEGVIGRVLGMSTIAVGPLGAWCPLVLAQRPGRRRHADGLGYLHGPFPALAA